ncbi:MAG: glutathione S-transferase family protein [Bradyrhizobium sp.]|nr:glutathione S-transferase family protein [Bradyrhizobium sp.]
MTVGDGEPVRAKSRELAVKAFGYAEARMAERGWWLRTLSIVEVYIDWAFSVASSAPFDVAPYPHLAALGARLSETLPAYRHMQEGEARARAALGLCPAPAAQPTRLK